MSEQFTYEDEAILTSLIKEAFRAQRMHNEKVRNRKLKVIKTVYGNRVYRSVLCSLRNDKEFYGYRMREKVG